MLELVKQFVGKHDEVQKQSRPLDTENADGKKGAFTTKNLETTAGISLFWHAPRTTPRWNVSFLHISRGFIAITVQALASDPRATAARGLRLGIIILLEDPYPAAGPSFNLHCVLFRIVKSMVQFTLEGPSIVRRILDPTLKVHVEICQT